MASSEPSKSVFSALQFLTCFTIFYIAPSCCQSHFEPPSIGLQETEITVGQTIHLTCSGELELSWNTPNSSGIIKRTTISTTPNNNDVRVYSSSLEVKDTIYTDTGSYSCYYKGYDGTMDISNERYNTSVYVFVYDPAHLFLPMSTYIAGTQYALLKIPCRPTSIDISVELYKGSSIEKGKKMDNFDDISFDPQQGFTVFAATPDYGSPFTCVGKLNDLIEKLAFQVFLFPATTVVPLPFINDSLAKDVVENNNFFLSCQIRAGKLVFLFMNWTYPNKGDPRIVEGTVYTVEKPGQPLRSTFLNLTVYNSQPSDEGTYKCTVTDHTGKSNTKSTSVIIHKASDQSIELLPVGFHEDQEIEYPLGDTLQLNVKVKSFPKPVLKWFKGDEVLLGDQHVTQHVGENSILTIQKLVRNDTSEYTLLGTAGNASASVTVSIVVTEKPIVHLNGTGKHPVPEVFLPYTKFVLVCKVEGCPMSDVKWEFRHCSDMLETDSCSLDVTVSSSSAENNEDISQVSVSDIGCIETSHLHGTANVQGFYRCHAQNSIGATWQAVPFVFNDYARKFILQVSHSTIYEQDDVNLTCAVSIYYYSQLKFSFTAIHLDSRIEDTVSTYTNTSVLHLNSVGLSHSGKYTCEALNVDTGVWDKLSKDIKVHKIVAPTVYKTNMNNTNYTLQKEVNFELYCHVNGTPSPTIKWYINGDPISLWNDSAMYISNSSLVIPRVVLSDSGTYACTASNRAGTLIFNATLTVLDVARGGLKTFVIVIIVVVVVLAIILIVLGVAFGKRCYNDRKNKMEIKALQKMLFTKGEIGIYNPDIPIEDQVDCLPYDQRWEFPREKLKLGRMIGQGAFGRVVKATATGIIPREETTVVAVKMLKEHADMEQRKSLMQELKIMIHIGQHVNVVNLLGAVTQNLHKGEFFVIVEYCRFGNLRNYIYLHRDSFFNQINYMTDQIESDKRASDIFMKPAGTRESEQTILNQQASDGSVSGCLLYPNSLYVSGQPVDGGTTGCTLYPNSLYTPFENNTASTTDGIAQVTSDGSMSQTGASDRTSAFSSSMKKFRTSRILTTSDLVCYAFQIACGMEYLSSKKLVHRDLALRNVLLAEDNILKICDFGLAKDCYTKNYYRKKTDGRLPIKWMAVESLRDKVFSAESDVWSFGVVMWELFTLGSSPYPGLDANEEFYKKLLNGSRMEKPEYSTENLYYMMLECWKHEPKLRPQFTNLRERLAALMDLDEVQHFYNMNEHLQVKRLAPDYMLMGALEENAETGEHDYVNQDVSTTDNEGYLVASPLPVGLNGKSANPFVDEHELKPMLRSEYGVGNGYFDMGKSSDC